MSTRVMRALQALHVSRRIVVMALAVTLGLTVAAAGPANASVQKTTSWGTQRGWVSGSVVTFQFSDHGRADGHCVIGQVKLSYNGSWQNVPVGSPRRGWDCTTSGWTSITIAGPHGLRVKRTGSPAAYSTLCSSLSRCYSLGGAP